MVDYVREGSIVEKLLCLALCGFVPEHGPRCQTGHYLFDLPDRFLSPAGINHLEKTTGKFSLDKCYAVHKIHNMRDSQTPILPDQIEATQFKLQAIGSRFILDSESSVKALWRLSGYKYWWYQDQIVYRHISLTVTLLNVQLVQSYSKIPQYSARFLFNCMFILQIYFSGQVRSQNMAYLFLSSNLTGLRL